MAEVEGEEGVEVGREDEYELSVEAGRERE